MIRTDDDGRVRLLTLDRPDKLNAFNDALYDATAAALRGAAADPEVAVVVITGRGRAFSTGTDVSEMSALASGETSGESHGFPGLVDALVDFPKPLLCAVNGLALGIGATMLGYADLVLMSTEARVRCPFTDLAVAPEAASSYTFPLLLGRQDAAWVLLSSEWFSAEECREMGLAWKVCAPDDLLPETMERARLLATKPVASLVETKRTYTAGFRDAVAAARAREDHAFVRLLGQPANTEAFTALFERRPPDFAAVDAAHPVDTARHASDDAP
ncbi:MAG: enoyl-CoA hydratase/isomerase family protein [Microthrixaceae bacterium]|nr:enoyl-CoA hydratase/isomerase family protein [Microthrixaceae bacterium]